MMALVGYLLIAGSLALGFHSFTMKTSIPDPSFNQPGFEGIVNLGLMQAQEMYLILSCTLLISGIILSAIGLHLEKMEELLKPKQDAKK
jgi:hypothetical protein